MVRKRLLARYQQDVPNTGNRAVLSEVHPDADSSRIQSVSKENTAERSRLTAEIETENIDKALIKV